MLTILPLVLLLTSEELLVLVVELLREELLEWMVATEDVDHPLLPSEDVRL